MRFFGRRGRILIVLMCDWFVWIEEKEVRVLYGEVFCKGGYLLGVI